MTRTAPHARPRLSRIAAAWLAAVLLAALLPGCGGEGSLADPADKALAEIEAAREEAAAEAEAEANKPQPKPEPKMNDENYVEITARSILIGEKYAEEPDQVETEIEKVYEKLGVTAAEYQEFRRALAPAKSGELQKKVQEKMQSLAHEYR